MYTILYVTADSTLPIPDRASFIFFSFYTSFWLEIACRCRGELLCISYNAANIFLAQKLLTAKFYAANVYYNIILVLH
jgi:hypothetical protein